MTPYFLVYGLEAILPADITFRAPRLKNYDEEQAKAVRSEDIDRAEEERLITYVHIAKYLEGWQRYYNRNIKGRSFAVDDLVLRRKQKLKACTSYLPLGKGLMSSKRLLDQGLIA